MNGETVLTAGRWQVAFMRRGDRFGHEIRWLAPPAAPRVLLVSREGAAEEDWPASPPLQELHLEQRGDDLSVALLVGMAGTSHWSLVVEAHAREERLVFDAACRLRAAPAHLGSHYRLSADQELAARVHGREFRLSGGGPAWSLVSEPLHDAPEVSLVYDEARRELALPLAGGEIARPQTWCWRYRLQLHA
ncbi:MAG: hypothetical protein KF708_18150 [Pirellulales bacterium]|nr:hypothetical protein [Pirellulales bacterium]